MNRLLVILIFAQFTMPIHATEPPKPAPIVLDTEQLAKLQAIAFQAAREGDLKTLQEYIKIGQPLNHVNGRGDTLLIVAAYNAQPKVVELILAQKDVKIDARNRMGLTALTAAAFKGDVEIAKLLIKAKADVNLANSTGQTSLMFAALAGRTAMVAYLLEAGANPNAKDMLGNTALKLAQTQGAKDVVALLEKAIAAGVR